MSCTGSKSISQTSIASGDQFAKNQVNGCAAEVSNLT